MKRLKELGIPFVRRKSGGGTVYHVRLPSSSYSISLLPFRARTDKERRRLVQDLGNTNYCVFVTRTEFDRTTNAELVSSALKKLSIPAYVNERNDICVDGFKMSPPLTRTLLHEVSELIRV